MNKKIKIIILCVLVVLVICFLPSFIIKTYEQHKYNSNIYFNTKNLDKFSLEEVDKSDYNKIPLTDNLYYTISDNLNVVRFYDKTDVFEKNIIGTILNEKIINIDNQNICLVLDNNYKIYNFDNDEYYDLNYSKDTYENMQLYADGDSLYVFGSKNKTTDVIKLSNNYNEEKKNEVPLDTNGGVIFFHLWDEYYVIQNTSYEYYTNCNKNLTKLSIDNKLELVNDEIFTLVHFGFTCDYTYYDYFYRHNLFYGDESDENEFYKEEERYNIKFRNESEMQYRYHMSFANYSKSNLKYKSDSFENIYQVNYNNIYYFIMTDCFTPYKQHSARGYYIIRFDTLTSEFKISDFNLNDRIEEINQVGNQIQLKLRTSNDEDLEKRTYYIK